MDRLPPQMLRAVPSVSFSDFHLGIPSIVARVPVTVIVDPRAGNELEAHAAAGWWST